MTIQFAFANTDQQIKQLLQSAPSSNLSQRVNYFSTAFLNQPYIIGPLGEGITGEFNQGPLYRLDGFDCQTYVETVMALSLAHNVAEFKSLINQIRYANGEVTFTKRNHFPSADWLPNNTQQGFIKDITKEVASKYDVVTAHAYIDKKQWYLHLTQEQLKIPNLTTEAVQRKLKQLQAQGQAVSNTWASVDYIPRKKFIINNKPNKALLAQIPNGSIIMIVNHPPTLRLIGTTMNITHMGFAIWQNNQLYFRAASTKFSRVTDINLFDYLREQSWIRGISVWQISPTHLIN